MCAHGCRKAHVPNSRDKKVIPKKVPAGFAEVGQWTAGPIPGRVIDVGQHFKWRKRLMISSLRGVAQLIQTRAEEGGFGAADGKRKKTRKSKDSVQRAMQIAGNASRDHTYMILDMRGQ